MFDPKVRKMPWRRKGQPTPVFLPGEFHGQRSLAGYSPWGHKEFDTTEQLNNNNKALNATPGVWKGLSDWVGNIIIPTATVSFFLTISTPQCLSKPFRNPGQRHLNNQPRGLSLCIHVIRGIYKGLGVTQAPCSAALGGGNSPGLFSEYGPIVSKSMP